VVEDFTCEPESRGWRRFGAGELFDWDRVAGRLRVTWDSSKTNSYFYKSLGQILSKADDFTFEFDLELESIAIGTTPGKPYTFQLALGLMNFAEATRADFFRGSGIHPEFGARSLAEFNYFPDSGFGATVAPTIVSSNNQIGFGGSFPLEMTTGDQFHVKMVYDATNEVLRTMMTRNGQPFGLPPDQTLRELSLAGFPDFRVDTLAVASYSDGGQSPPEFAGSILADGTVDNLRVQMPPSPVAGMTGSFGEHGWQVSFVSRLNYSYVLERSSDLAQWESASALVEGTGGQLVLEDHSGTADHFFYRVQVLKP
jgi:hypothetical protein